ncbi:MAG: hypothetical protein JKY37_14670 [Nannocystaceae bacterium]|nr:hypothetical protein [Nannocystaceae bacterium]
MRTARDSTMWFSGLVSALLVSAAVACAPSDRTLASYADEWADVLCTAHDACRCAQENCVAEEASRFIELWGEGGSEVKATLPDAVCWGERLALMADLSCDETEASTFDWETRACPLRTNFAGVGEPCLALGGSAGLSWAVCERGLVCEARSSRCVSPTAAPREGESCYFSADPPGYPGHCRGVLVCGDDGICGPGTVVPIESTIVCTDVVFAL